ncbi:uncharacterized protein BCR38DRAFT_110569 [Pseudomassariella vexata]|uniref:Uncharacterized protein n=1 Tax=Pseudomassariella vexata TaxID=1141098 RepID=A0A1Y2DDJ5_9PEZI|nr:uncharacterized protein BCR38DRAFT_110569 [Pseudomassariella vexata]ORY57267.1 hypothetical protein BCR38DRAFT_110569 [Pseudomassariella vexata]
MYAFLPVVGLTRMSVACCSLRIYLRRQVKSKLIFTPGSGRLLILDIVPFGGPCYFRGRTKDKMHFVLATLQSLSHANLIRPTPIGQVFVFHIVVFANTMNVPKASLTASIQGHGRGKSLLSGIHMGNSSVDIDHFRPRTQFPRE